MKEIEIKEITETLDKRLKDIEILTNDKQVRKKLKLLILNSMVLGLTLCLKHNTILTKEIDLTRLNNLTLIYKEYTELIEKELK